MELPSRIKELYKHWDTHCTDTPRRTKEIPEHLWWFIEERTHIWEQRVQDKEPPYTKDPILSQYRFCNVFRELDRQTIEIHEMLNPLREDFPLWLLNMFYARMVARPQTLRQVGLLSFTDNEDVCQKLSTLPRPRYGTPYVFPVSVILKSDTPTRELFITKYLPQVMRTIADEIQTWEKVSVCEGLDQLIPLFGFNLKFLWTEVLIDVAYQYPKHIDLFKRFPLGPGSLPTFKKLSENPEEFVEKLSHSESTTPVTCNGRFLKLSAENWEGMGCEYRKYTNLSQRKGRKRTYKK